MIIKLLKKIYFSFHLKKIINNLKSNNTHFKRLIINYQTLKEIIELRDFPTLS